MSRPPNNTRNSPAPNLYLSSAPVAKLLKIIFCAFVLNTWAKLFMRNGFLSMFKIYWLSENKSKDCTYCGILFAKKMFVYTQKNTQTQNNGSLLKIRDGSYYFIHFKKIF